MAYFSVAVYATFLIVIFLSLPMNSKFAFASDSSRPNSHNLTSVTPDPLHQTDQRLFSNFVLASGGFVSRSSSRPVTHEFQDVHETNNISDPHSNSSSKRNLTITASADNNNNTQFKTKPATIVKEKDAHSLEIEDENVLTQACLEAVHRCAHLDQNAAPLEAQSRNDVQMLVAHLQKQQLAYQEKIERFRDFFMNALNKFVSNPDVFPDTSACFDVGVPFVTRNTPTVAIPDDVTVSQSQQCCNLSEWSAWSVPLGFGLIERRRSVLKEGQCCPDLDTSVEQVNLSSVLINKDALQNPVQVAASFKEYLNRGSPRDILLIIDTSSSISVDDFNTLREGIKIMIDLFCGTFGPADSNNKLAIIQYSTVPYLIHSFSDPQMPDALKGKVASMLAFGGKTCTGDALMLAHDEVLTLSQGARANITKDTLLITDGRANCGADVVKSAQLLSHRSASVYALAIGIADDASARQQITSIVKNQDPHHIFSLARFSDFKTMINYLLSRKMDQACIPFVSLGEK